MRPNDGPNVSCNHFKYSSEIPCSHESECVLNRSRQALCSATRDKERTRQQDTHHRCHIVACDGWSRGAAHRVRTAAAHGVPVQYFTQILIGRTPGAHPLHDFTLQNSRGRV